DVLRMIRGSDQPAKEPARDLVKQTDLRIKRGEPVEKVTGDLLGLALRAYVQKSNMAEARTILNVMRELAVSDGSGSSPAASLRPLIQELKVQIQDLRRQGKPAEAQLNQTIKNFSAFLDELAKEMDVSVQEIDKLTNEVGLLANQPDKKAALE